MLLLDLGRAGGGNEDIGCQVLLLFGGPFGGFFLLVSFAYLPLAQQEGRVSLFHPLRSRTLILVR